MKIGIVGMPNAGKSSLFNALTRAGAQAANYPFTTLEPNVAVVGVPDERLDRVAETIGARPGEGVEQRRLARVGQPDDPDLHRVSSATAPPSAAPATVSDG